MGTPRRIFIASDHAGVELKTDLEQLIRKEFGEWAVEDLGPASTGSVDYPDFAAKVARKVGEGQGLGILICGSGIGMSIAANKIAGVRAALVSESTAARLSRMHNDANVLCLGARLIGREVALDCVRAFLRTPFEGGRHSQRIKLISDLEQA